MEEFNIDERKRILNGDVGYKWCLERPIAESESVGGLASSANADLTEAIYCILVGYMEPAKMLLEKAHEWLTIAIRNEEHPNYYFAEGTEAQRYCDIALVNWLLEGVHDSSSLEKYVKHQDKYLQGEVGRDKVSVSFVLPDYVDAGRYHRALEIFGSTPGLKTPTRLDRIRSEAAMVYVICRHKLGLDYTDEELRASLQAFLNRSVNGWLVHGHAQQAAKWMKIAYWNDQHGGLTPEETVLKCFYHLG